VVTADDNAKKPNIVFDFTWTILGYGDRSCPMVATEIRHSS